MIDLATENLIPLNEVPKLLPRRRTGRPIHLSAIYRWRQKGIRGIRLETTTLGGTTYTSKEALARFAEALTGRPCNHLTPTSPISRMTRTRQAQARRAEQQVREQLGIRQAAKNTDTKNSSASSNTPDAPCQVRHPESQHLIQTKVDEVDAR